MRRSRCRTRRKFFSKPKRRRSTFSWRSATRRSIDAVHEVVVRVTATAKVKDKVLFLVEGKQGGIFEIRNLSGEQMGPVLGVVCPGIIYPYLRANIADLISRTGLPAIHLAEINFEAFYSQKMAAMQQQSANSCSGRTPATR